MSVFFLVKCFAVFTSPSHLGIVLFLNLGKSRCKQGWIVADFELVELRQQCTKRHIVKAAGVYAVEEVAQIDQLQRIELASRNSLVRTHGAQILEKEVKQEAKD